MLEQREACLLLILPPFLLPRAHTFVPFSLFFLPFSFRSHEEEANEKRKKRFAREHDIEESRGRAVSPMVQGLGDLSIAMKRGGKKKFGNLGYAVDEPEPMFDPVSTVEPSQVLLQSSR